MSTPKLKIYRLPEGYNEKSEIDVRSIVNDELVPVVKKDLDVFNMEELVPVAERRDCRLVREKTDINGSAWHTVIVPLAINENNIANVKTKPICCDGWVLGQGNIEVSVFKITQNAVDYLTSENSSFVLSTYLKQCAENFSRLQVFDSEMESKFGTWSLPLDLKYWKYEVTTKKVMTGALGNIVQVASDAVRYNQSDYITFSFGDMMNGDVLLPNLTSSGTDVYLPMVGVSAGAFTGYVMIRYKLYEELSLDENNHLFTNNTLTNGIQDQTSVYRAPFGDIYNGGKSGRDIRYALSGEVSKSIVSHYEGNYTHKRRILPLRVLVGKKQGSSDNTFLADIEYSGNTIAFEAQSDWYLDGIMRPVAMEKIRVYNYNGTNVANPYYMMSSIDGGETEYTQVTSAFPNFVVEFDGFGESRGDNVVGEVLKQLDEDSQIGALRPNPTANGIQYVVSFKDTYYKKSNSVYLYPDQVFLAYNTFDDAMGNIGDFNYDYSAWQTLEKYGHENNGKFIASNNFGESNVFFNQDGVLYKKKDILCVCDDGVSGYDSEKMWLLTQDETNHRVAFVIPESWNNSSISLTPGFKVYSQTKLVYDSNNLQLDSGYSINGILGSTLPLQVSFNVNLETSLPTELMVVYYEAHEIGFEKLQDSSSNWKNPWCIGYRIPCYEKTRRSKHWVSSYPNWVSGHLNNDLDVFYGNTEYSGTNTTTQSNNGIYPCYQEFGEWQAYYNDGYVEFNDVKESIDYFDIFNFSSLISSSINLSGITLPNIPTCLSATTADAQKLTLYYAKAKVNVAHFDGIFAAHRCKLSNYSCKGGQYWYAPLEDDDFSDVIGKKWITKSDKDIQVLYENNRNTYPATSSVTETLNAITTNPSNAHEIWRVDTTTNRISLMRYQINTADRSDLVLLINPTDSGGTRAISDGSILDTDVRVHVNIRDFDGETCFCVGLESPLVDKSQIFAANVDWTPLPDFENVYNNGVGIGEVHSQAPRYKYEDVDWYYDVYVELISYRYASYTSTSKTVSMVEFAVYKVDKPR